MRNRPGTLNYFSQRPPCLPSASKVVSTCIKLPPCRLRRVEQRRTFLDPTAFDGLFAGITPLRQLTHSRVLPYPRSAVFDAIAAVERYPSFLPFVLSANVSARDQSHHPTRASLTVGYDALGIKENWESIVRAEEGEGIIEARSADTAIKQGDGLFEVLKTKWQLQDVEDPQRQGAGQGDQTAVRLDVEVKFRSAMYDKMFSGVEERVAEMMVGAFEKRLRELAGS